MDLAKYGAEWVPLSSIDYGDKTFQYRQHVVEEDVADLAESMRQFSQDIPIILRRMPGGRLQIVCGFRRATAAIKINWEKIRSIVVPLEDLPEPEARKLSARENIQRGQYSSLDKMFMCKKLSEQGVSNIEIGAIVGKTEGQIRRYIKVAQAPTEVHEKIQSGETTISNIADKPARSDYEQSVDNTKYKVNSARNVFNAMLSIAISQQAGPTIDAFIAEIRKAWKEALKKSQSRRFGGTKIRLSGGPKTSLSGVPQPVPGVKKSAVDDVKEAIAIVQRQAGTDPKSSIFQLESLINAMNQTLADPAVSEAEKSGLKEQLQSAQSALDQLKNGK